VVKVIAWMMETVDSLKMTDDSHEMQDGQGVENLSPVTCHLSSGLYNLGTGRARSFYDLAAATFRGMDLEPNIVFIDMPEDIRDKYQYFTEANMAKLRAAGYAEPFTSLEDGVDDYVRNYLRTGLYY
jgi:ADP-L-glycero-D-manno-heptose 6-epimerase